MRESITPEESTEPIVIEEIGVRLGVEDRSTTSGKTEADFTADEKSSNVRFFALFKNKLEQIHSKL
jgi:hypothetical protein